MIVSLKEGADSAAVLRALATRGLWVSQVERAASGGPAHYVIAPHSAAASIADIAAIEGVSGVTTAKSPFPLVEKQGPTVNVSGVAITACAPRPVLMCGPCAVESEHQVFTIAATLASLGVSFLRGGAYKPRTSPYAFQGLGWAGLDLLVAAGQQAGLPVITEVMAVDQVARMAAAADILQVGARNMQNFDLLREVGKVDRPVLLKRGLSSTIEEWLAAAEYVVAQGNQQVILCERGIRTFESATRNTLDLSAVVVVRERSHLPIIVDPSHGTGSRPYVAPMAWAARAAGAHGLLVEVHPEPAKALSDAEQSLSPAEFADLMRHLATVPQWPTVPAVV